MLLVSLVFVFAIILNEAVVELVAKSGFFKPMRDYVFARANSSKLFAFFTLVLSCPYCTSVWTSALFSAPIAAVLMYHVGVPFDLLLVLLVPVIIFIHRVSNYLHNVGDRYFTRTEDV